MFDFILYKKSNYFIFIWKTSIIYRKLLTIIYVKNARMSRQFYSVVVADKYYAKIAIKKFITKERGFCIRETTWIVVDWKLKIVITVTAIYRMWAIIVRILARIWRLRKYLNKAVTTIMLCRIKIIIIRTIII